MDMEKTFSSLELFQHAEKLFEPAEINEALTHVARDIERDFADKDPLCLIVMLGGFVFAGQLLPKIKIPLEVDYIHATRYRGEMQAADAIHWLVKPNNSLKDRHILILDDILDEGVTLAEIINYCQAHGALSVKTAVMVDKNVPRSPKGIQHADYAALKTENAFLFGYGMDCKEYWRNADGIYALIPNKK